MKYAFFVVVFDVVVFFFHHVFVFVFVFFLRKDGASCAINNKNVLRLG